MNEIQTADIDCLSNYFKLVLFRFYFNNNLFRLQYRNLNSLIRLFQRDILHCIVDYEAHQYAFDSLVYESVKLYIIEWNQNFFIFDFKTNEKLTFTQFVKSNKKNNFLETQTIFFPISSLKFKYSFLLMFSMFRSPFLTAIFAHTKINIRYLFHWFSYVRKTIVLLTKPKYFILSANNDDGFVWLFTTAQFNTKICILDTIVRYNCKRIYWLHLEKMHSDKMSIGLYSNTFRPHG